MNPDIIRLIEKDRIIETVDSLFISTSNTWKATRIWRPTREVIDKGHRE